MNASELEIFNSMPFLFWIKDEDYRYIWGNRVIAELAGEDVVGKTDDELVWAADAESLREADRQVFASGEPSFVHEQVKQSSRGTAALSVCKWLGEVEGRPCCFGISFVIG